MNIKKQYVGVNRNIKEHGLIFHYSIRTDNLMSIGYVDVRQIKCSCSEFLGKLSYPLNRIKDRYNQV